MVRALKMKYMFGLVLFYSCQQAFLNNMREVGQNIAHNRALCENVMMMVVCVNVRIPLFLIGKPGSSKSLAKTIFKDSSVKDNAFLEHFKEVSIIIISKGIDIDCYTSINSNSFFNCGIKFWHCFSQ